MTSMPVEWTIASNSRPVPIEAFSARSNASATSLMVISSLSDT